MVIFCYLHCNSDKIISRKFPFFNAYFSSDNSAIPSAAFAILLIIQHLSMLYDCRYCAKCNRFHPAYSMANIIFYSRTTQINLSQYIIINSAF